MKKTFLKFGLAICLFGSVALVSCSSSDDDKGGSSGTGIDVNGTVESSFAQKVLVEDYTGAWCGWCPRVAWALQRTQQSSEDVVGVAIHYGSTSSSSGSYDPFMYSGPYSSQIQGMADSYPTAYINRTELWDANENQHLTQVTNKLGVAEQGVAISSSVSDNTITINAYAGYHTAASTPITKFIVYITENHLYVDQHEYNSPQMFSNLDLEVDGNGIPYYPDFEMNEVLRYAVAYNAQIPSAENKAGNIYGLQYTADLSSFDYEDVENLEVVVILTDNDGNALNTAHAALGEEISFDYAQ